MPRFTKRPIAIEAERWDGTAEDATAIIDSVLVTGGTARYDDNPPILHGLACRCDGRGIVPGAGGLGSVSPDPCPETEPTGGGEPFIAIDTLEGTMRAKPGDWIVRGVAGEFYPVDNAIFEETYEPGSRTVSARNLTVGAVLAPCEFTDHLAAVVQGIAIDPSGDWYISMYLVGRGLQEYKPVEMVDPHFELMSDQPVSVAPLDGDESDDDESDVDAEIELGVGHHGLVNVGVAHDALVRAATDEEFLEYVDEHVAEAFFDAAADVNTECMVCWYAAVTGRFRVYGDCDALGWPVVTD